MLWKDLEPEEGKYAWIYNERYKWYIQKAKDKGLKLAFRVFFHGVDGVPSYVYEAGATESPIDDEAKPSLIMIIQYSLKSWTSS